MSKVNMKETDYYKSGKQIKYLSIAKDLAVAQHHKNKQERIASYDLSPKCCTECNIPLDYESRNKKFCTSSCAAKYNNSRRKPRSKKSKNKTSLSIKKYLKDNAVPIFTKVSQCVICGKFHPRIAKTCSDECYSELLSIKVIERIKRNKRSNFRRDKKSYLESSFEQWLKDNNILTQYLDEHTIRNHLTRKWYFVDFYFPEVNLIIELDGKQHEKPKHKQADKERDEYITTHLGIKVFRISYDEYQSGSKIEMLKTLLVPRPGNAPGFTG